MIVGPGLITTGPHTRRGYSSNSCVVARPTAPPPLRRSISALAVKRMSGSRSVMKAIRLS